MRKSIIFLASIALVTLSLSLSIFAQRTTGDIQGTVTDPNGAVVPGAAITVTGVNVGLTRNVTADDSGVYHVLQLPPGNYQVTVAAFKGFAAQTKTVPVQSNNLTELNFTMSATANASVTVSSTDATVIDPTETKAQTTLSARQIDALPKGTNFTSLLKTSVAARSENLAGGVLVNGATGPENSFLIDGQETQNYYNGLLNSNNDIPYQSIQEIQLKTSGFEAEFGGATGGVVSAITKSGSDSFHGTAQMQWDSQKLDAGPHPVRNVARSTNTAIGPTIATTGQFLEFLPQARDAGLGEFPSLELSGPLLPKRVWFYVNHSPRVVTATRVTNYVSGFGALRTPTVLSSSLLALGASTTESVTERDVYNYSFGRVDASPFKSLRLTASYTWNPLVIHNPVLGGSYVIGSPGTATLAGTTYQGADLARFQGGRQNSDNFRSEGIWTPTSNIVIDVRYSHGFLNQKTAGYGVASDPRIQCVQISSITGGLTATQLSALAGCAQGFSNVSSNDVTAKNISLRNQWDIDGTYLFSAGGHHEVKGGYERSSLLNDISTGSVFPNGQGRAYLYYGVGTTGLDCSFVYVQWEATCPAGRTTYPLPTLPAGVSVIGSGVNYQFGSFGKATDLANAIFIQDKWQPTSRLTLNLGVRLENENIPAFNAQRIDLKWGWGDKVAPRLGVAYALTKDGKTKISGLYGQFFDRMKFALPQGSFGGQFYHVDYFYITSDHPQYTYYTVANLHGSFNFPNGGTCPITLTNPNGYLCDQDYRIASNVPGSDIYTNGAVDPNVKPYQQREMTFEFQRQVRNDTDLTVRYINRKLIHVIEDAGIPTPSGSEAYVIGNPGEGLAGQLLKSLNYTNVAVPERKYNALQVEVNTRYIHNLSANLNYTYSRLWGNYSGLANPDELTAAGTPRLDPNVSRGFDEPWVGFAAGGGKDNGLLPLDRPHVFKASGAYDYNWSKANTTTLGFFYTIESGTPRTTFYNIFGIPIVATKRGDLGRTPVFSQTDLNLTHRYRFGADMKYTIAVDLNVVNVFNQDTVLAFDQNETSGYWAFRQGSVVASGDTVAATNVLTTSGVLTQYAAAEAAICAPSSTICGTSVGRNIAFNTPLVWQSPRTVRFGLRFVF